MNHLIKKSLRIVFLFFFTGTFARVSDGSLDFNFNRSAQFSGVVTSEIGSNAAIKALAIQADGKIIGVGYNDSNGYNTFAVFRYNPNGTLDKTFGANGMVTTRFGATENASNAQAVAIQMDGKIVVGGFTNAIKNNFSWCLARYNPNGTLDTTFFGGRGIYEGTVITHFGSDYFASQLAGIAIQTDGKIIAVGNAVSSKEGSRFAIARYLPNGALDQHNFNTHGMAPGTKLISFGSFGKLVDQAQAVALQPDGKIVVAGSSQVSGAKTFAIARIAPNGTLDSSFFSGGLATIPGTAVISFLRGETQACAYAVALQPDGKIVVAGQTNSNSSKVSSSRLALARLENSGCLDTSFGGKGLAKAEGTIITSFGTKEKNSCARALVVQADGKLVVGGITTIDDISYCALGRYNADGSLDTAFNGGNAPAGLVRTQLKGSKNNECCALAIQSDGALIAGGTTDAQAKVKSMIARYVAVNAELAVPALDMPHDGACFVDSSAIELTGTAQQNGALYIFINDQVVGMTNANGTSKKWAYKLPALDHGDYKISVMQHYDSGKIILAGRSPITIRVDKVPKAKSAYYSLCGAVPFNGSLEATGGSGNYSFSLISAHNSTVEIHGNTFTIVPTIGFGEAHFRFKVYDVTTHQTGIGIITIFVKKVPVSNDVQLATSQGNTVTGDLSSQVTGIADPFAFELVGNPVGGTAVLSGNGSFDFVPAPGFNGVGGFQYLIKDSQECYSNPAQVSITVSVPPVAQSEHYSMYQDATLRNNLKSLVTDGQTPYLFNQVANAQNGTAGIKPNGSWMFVPAGGFHGVASFAYQAIDANGGISNVATIEIQVIQLPAASHQAYSTQQNKKVTQTLADLAKYGVPPYTFSVVGDATNGVVSLNGDGSFVFQPADNYVGKASFAYQISDANNKKSDAYTVSITVNETPKIAAASFTTCQETAINGNLMSYVSGGKPPYQFVLSQPFSQGRLELNTDGTFVATPHNEFYGTTSFDYYVSDENGSISEVATATIQVNQLPIATDNYSTTVCQDMSVTTQLSPLVVGGKPPYHFALTDSAQNAGAVLADDGTLTFTPALGFSGATALVFVVVDANQCVSKPCQLSITVHPKPIIADASFDTVQDRAVQGSLAEFISNGTAPYTFNQVGQATKGSAQINSDGTFSFFPTFSFVGQVSFAYQVSDANGCLSDVAIVDVSVHSLPHGSNHAYQTVTNLAVTDSLVGLVSKGTPPYQFSVNVNAQNGIVQVDSDGTFSYTPNPDYEGNDGFAYGVCDAYNACTTGTLSVVVNKRVSAADFSLTMCQDKSITANVADVVSGGIPPYTFAASDAQQFGDVTMTSQGELSFEPLEGFFGMACLTYTITDTTGLPSVPGKVNILVHQSPLAADSDFDTVKNRSLTASLTQLVGAGTQPYQFAQIGQAVNAQVEISPEGNFTLVPDTDFIGAITFQYQVTDANGCQSAVANVLVTVHQLPQAGNASYRMLVNSELQNSLDGLVSNGTPPYSFSVVAHANNGSSQVEDDGTFTYAPTANCRGTDSFVYGVSDLYRGMATGAIDFLIHDPVMIGQANFSICQDNSVQGDLSTIVSGGIPPYVFAATGSQQFGSFTMTPQGTWNFSPASGFFGVAQLPYTVNDTTNEPSATGVLHILVHQSPLVADSDFNTVKNRSLTASLAQLVGAGTPPYQFIQIGQALNAQVEISPEGNFTLVPDTDFVGAITFQYQVTDANGCQSAVANVLVTVHQLPQAGNAAYRILVNSDLQNSLDTLVSNGTPPYNFSVVANAQNGSVQVEDDGTFTYTPAANYRGTDSFVYGASDLFSGRATGAIGLLIHDPVMAGPISFGICQDASLAGNVSNAVTGGLPPYAFAAVENSGIGNLVVAADGSFIFNPLAGYYGTVNLEYLVHDTTTAPNATGAFQVVVNQKPVPPHVDLVTVQNKSLTLQLAPFISGGTLPYQFAQIGTAVNAQCELTKDGTCTITPNPNFIGTVEIQYQVSDANGCTSNPANLTVVVATVPVASNASYGITQNSLLESSLLNYVSQGTPPYIFALGATAHSGQAIINPDGAFSYLPFTDYSGTDSFGYTLVDAYLGQAQAHVDLIINQPLKAATSTASTCQNNIVKGNISELVSGGFPPYTYAVSADSLNGHVVIDNDGNYTFTPESGFVGKTKFTYQVTDTQNIQRTGHVSIQINALPLIGDISYNLCQYAVLKGDLITGITSHGQPPYVFEHIGSTVNGTTVMKADGSFTFNPEANFLGIGSFNYQLTDANGCMSNVATVTVAINPLPVANGATLTVNPDLLLTGTLSHFSSGQGPFTFTAIGVPLHGHVIITPKGDFTFIPDEGFTGTAGFQYQISDANGCQSNIATITVMVNAAAEKSENHRKLPSRLLNLLKKCGSK